MPWFKSQYLFNDALLKISKAEGLLFLYGYLVLYSCSLNKHTQNINYKDTPYSINVFKVLTHALNKTKKPMLGINLTWAFFTLAILYHTFLSIL
ncbi:hypothetical protein PA7559_07480 [Pseudoalteromonas distincta]